MNGGLIGKVSLFLIGLVIVAEILAFVRPLPALTPQVTLNGALPTQTINLTWPSSGQSALGAQGFGLLATNGSQTPAPIASVAKIITAMSILKQRPLNPGQQGPTITLGQADVDNYQAALSEEGSVVPVTAGEQISERQAIEAMLLPSANNMARSLAEWAFGSLDSYVSFANSYVKTLGLSHTKIIDASGFNPATTSTASDLVNLALAAMANPTLASISAETQASLPVAGTITNTNSLLGTDGIIGVKTGNTDQAGGCFMFAAKHNLFGQNVLIVGAVMNAPTLYQAMSQAKVLLASADGGFAFNQTVAKNHPVGVYGSSWGTYVAAVASADFSFLSWKGHAVTITTHLDKLPAGTKMFYPVGNISAKTDSKVVSVSAISNRTATKPSVKWRLLHP